MGTVEIKQSGVEWNLKPEPTGVYYNSRFNIREYLNRRTCALRLGLSDHDRKIVYGPNVGNIVQNYNHAPTTK